MKTKTPTTIKKFLISILIGSFVFSPAVSEAVIFEPGFETEVVASGFVLPTAMAFAQDGRIFIAEKGGTVRVVKNGALLPTPVISLTDINTFADRGLIGIATDPNFLTNGYLYLSYTYENTPGANFGGSKTGRVVRVTVVGDVAEESSKVVLVGTVGGNAATPSCDDYALTDDCIPSNSGSHSVGGLRFGTDGKLYATMGDGAHFDFVDPNSMKAQNLDSLAGKVLRINTDGTAPSDNPFYTGNANDNRSKVYALGVRNAYRLNVNQATGAMYLGDVGWSSWEEVNLLTPGANYGWPCREGLVATTHNCTPSSAASDPLYTYAHDASGAGSIAVGSFPSSGAYPAAYNTSLFFGDYAQNFIKRLVLDAAGAVVSVQDFMDDPNGPVDISTGPDGNVYYLAIYTGDLMRITHTTGNRRPVPTVAATPTSGLAPLSVAFSSAGSYDPDGDALTYLWNFGDGATSNEQNPTHEYTANGSYSATLLLTDALGSTVSKSVDITVGNQAPAATITSPASGSLYMPFDSIQLSGDATDLEDGTLPASAFHWQIILHHNVHIHHIEEFTNTKNPTIIAPDHEGDDIYTEVVLTVTDSAGLTDTRSINLYLNNGTQSGNLITNPSVEVEDSNPNLPLGWVNGWYGVLDPTFTYPASGLEGAKAMKVALASYTEGSAKWYFSPVFVTPGETYNFRSHYTSNVQTVQYAQLGFSDGTNQYVQTAVLPPSATSALVEYAITIPAGVQTLSILHEIAAVGELTTDDFSLMLASEELDTTPPTASVTAPANGATVSGNAVVINATAADNVGVAGVKLVIDGVDAIGEDTENPYAYVWNTTLLADGPHTIAVRARDPANNVFTSPAINVTVQNSTSTQPTNLILNPSLETDGGAGNPANWLRGGWGTNTAVFTYPVAGSQGAKGAKVELTAFTNGDAKWFFTDVPVTAGDDYTIAHDYKSTATTEILARWTLAGGATQYQFLGTVPASAAWTTSTYNLTAPTGATSVTLFHVIASVGSLEIDNFSLTAQNDSSFTAAITSPSSGAALSGIVTVSVTAGGPAAEVKKVKLFADNVDTGIEYTTEPFENGPFEIMLNTALFPNGPHNLQAVAIFDTNDEVPPPGFDTATSSPVAVTINNSTGTPANLIQNPSLETAGAGGDPANWLRGGWGTNNRVFTYPTTGVAGADAAKVEITSYTDGDAKWYFTDVPVTPGTAYTFSHQYKSTVSTQILARYTMTGGATQYAFMGVLPASASWATSNFTLTAPANAASVTVFHVVHSVGALEIDNFSLTGPGGASDTTDPTVSVTAPASGASVSGIVNITATAADNIGIAGVTFFVDGNMVGNEDTSAPYTHSLNTTTFTNGSHVITARARDAANNTATSVGVPVTFFFDGNPPSVSITSPANGSTVSESIVLTANATDDVGVLGVTFVIDGTFSSPEDTEAPYTYTLDTRNFSNGSHSVTANAHDAQTPVASTPISLTFANTASSTNIILNPSLENGPESNGDPTSWESRKWGNNTTIHTYPSIGFDGGRAAKIEMTSYSDGDARWWTKAPISIEVGKEYVLKHRYKSTGPTQIELRYGNGQTFYFDRNIATSWTVSEIRFTPVSNTIHVAHLLHGVGTLEIDDFSLTQVSIGDTTDPTVSVTSPASGATLTGTVSVTANAADNVGVAGVSLLVDGAVVGAEDTTSPYAFSLNTATLTNGAHSISARARDAAGNDANATAVSVTVNNGTSTSTNLISNGDLETVNGTLPLDWTGNSWGNHTAVHTYPVVGYNGQKAVRTEITAYPPLPTGTGDAKWVFKKVPVTPGTEYTYSDHYRSNTISDIIGQYTLTDGSFHYFGLAKEIQPNTTWQTITGKFTPPANATHVTLFHLISAVGYLEIDDAEMYITGSSTPSETNAPIVAFTNPLEGQTVSGIVPVTASSTDDTAVTYIFYAVDGVPVTGQITTAPYLFDWDTSTVANGPHLLKATTHDPYGNNSTHTITVNVNNVAVPSGPTNLIQNPSFETDAGGGNVTNWTKGGWGTNNRVFTYPITGADGGKAAKVQMTSYTDGDAKWFFDNVPITGGNIYTFENKYRSDVITNMTIRYTMSNGTTQYIGIANPPASELIEGEGGSEPAWSIFTHTFSPPAGAVSMSVMHILHSVGYLEVDEYKLYAGNPSQFNNGKISLIFDDGWISQYTTALPMLQTANMKAGFYIITDETLAEGTGSNPELIGNAGLETVGGGGDPAGWLRGGWGTNDRVFTYPIAGDASASAARVAITTYTNGDAKWYFTDVPVTVGKQYTLKDRYNSNVETYATVRYTKTDGTSFYAYQGALASTGGTWQSFERTITVPADVASMTLFHVIGSVGQLTVDNFSLKEVGGAAPAQDYMNSAQVLEIQAAGHEIGSHTKTHPDLSTLSGATLQDEVVGSRDALLGMGVTQVDTIVYPYGGYDAEVIATAQGAGYIGGRSVERGYNTPDTNKFALQIQGVLRDTTLAEVQNWVNQAAVNNAWLILMFHEVDNDPTNTFGTTPEILQGIINHVSTADIDVITMRQGIQLMTGGASLSEAPPTINGALSVSVSAVPISQNVVAGAQGFTLANYVFDTTGSQEDVQLASIPLVYRSSNTASPNLGNCQIFDGATPVTATINPSGNSSSTPFVFNAQGYVLAKDATKTLSLKCNVPNTAIPNTEYSFGLDSAQAASYTGAVGVTSGTVVNEVLNLSPGQSMRVIVNGTLSVVLDTTSPTYRIVSAGSIGVELARIRYSASNEDIDLKQVALQISDTGLNSPIDLVGGRVTLWTTEGTQVGTAIFGSSDYATSSVIAAGAFRIPKDSSKVLVIKGDISQISSSGPLMASGDLLKVNYDGDNEGVAGNYGIGVSSGLTNVPNNSDTSSQGVRIMAAYPVIEYPSFTPPVLENGTNKVLYRFKITAVDGDIALYKVAFGITSDISATTSAHQVYAFTDSGFNIPDSTFGGATPGLLNADTPNTQIGESPLQVRFQSVPGINRTYIIANGQSRWFELRATISNVETGPGSQTLAVVFAAHANSFVGMSSAIDMDTNKNQFTQSTFMWSPISTTTPDTLSLGDNDFTNGYRVIGTSPTQFPRIDHISAN